MSPFWDRVQDKISFGSNNSPICRRCRKLDIVKLLREGPKFPPVVRIPGRIHMMERENGLEQRIDLGPLNSLKYSSKCPGCTALKCIVKCAAVEKYSDRITLFADWVIQRIERTTTSDNGTYVTSEGASYQCARLLHAGYWPSWAEFWGAGEEAWIPYDSICILQEHNDQKQPALLGGRRIEPTVNVDLLRRWLHICDEDHSATCRSRGNHRLDSIKLIDVLSETVVKYPAGNGPCRYFCLSYVWGGVAQARCRLGPLPASMPRTIVDTIQLVRSLGERYLWVDSVCIDQGDENDKAQQINLMASIYQGAYATIACLYGDSAESGLPRLHRSEARTSQTVVDLEGTTIVSTGKTLAQQIETSVWGTRAWTLQEMELSSRVLYFTMDQVYYDCHVMQRQESIQDPEPEVSLHWHNTVRLLSRSWYSARSPEGPSRIVLNNDPPRAIAFPDDEYDDYYEEYNTLATHYSKRQMTNDSDALNAVSAVIEVMTEHRFRQGFFFGIAREVFISSLLWFHPGNARRRPQFPSWSWIGWEGSIGALPRPCHTYQDSPGPNGVFFKAMRAVGPEFQVLDWVNPPEQASLHPYLTPNRKGSVLASVCENPQQAWNLCKTTERQTKAIFLTGFVWQAKFSKWRSKKETDSDQKTVSFQTLLGSVPCKIICNSPASATYVQQNLGKPMDMILVYMHSLCHADDDGSVHAPSSHYYLHTLIVEWTQGVAHRVGSVDVKVPWLLRDLGTLMKASVLVRGCVALE